MSIEQHVNAEKSPLPAVTALNTIVIHSTSSSKIDQLAGWQTALILANKLKATTINIIHICQPLGFCEKSNKEIVKLSMPSLSLLDQVGINEKQLFSSCQAQHNLGNIYNGWSSEEQCFSLVDGDYGVDFDNVEFQHYLSSIVKGDFNKKIDDFSLAALMAKSGRFVQPVLDNKSILSTFTYRINVELESYCQLIKDKAIALGVTEYSGHVIDVEMVEVNSIRYVSCKKKDGVSKDIIHADFFFDCVKDSKLTLNEKLKEKLDVSRYSSPIDSMFSVAFPSPEELKTSDILTTYQFGYTKVSHLKCISIIHCYFNDKTTVDEVLEELSQQGILLNKDCIDVENFTPYLVTVPWQQNRVLLGRARASVDSIDNDFIDLLQKDIALWLTCFPRKNCSSHLSKYFNETSTATYLSKLDFNQAHYLLSDWRDSSFWKQKKKHLSSSLEHTIDMFRQTGTIPVYEAQYINEKKWSAFLMGFNCIPRHYDPLIDSQNRVAIERKLFGLHLHIEQFLQKLPNYKTYKDKQGL